MQRSKFNSCSTCSFDDIFGLHPPRAIVRSAPELTACVGLLLRFLGLWVDIAPRHCACNQVRVLPGRTHSPTLYPEAKQIGTPLEEDSVVPHPLDLDFAVTCHLREVFTLPLSFARRSVGQLPTSEEGVKASVIWNVSTDHQNTVSPFRLTLSPRVWQLSGAGVM